MHIGGGVDQIIALGKFGYRSQFLKSDNGSRLLFNYLDIVNPGTKEGSVVVDYAEVDGLISTNGIAVHRDGNQRKRLDIDSYRIPLRFWHTIRIIASTSHQTGLKDILNPMYIGGGIDQHIALSNIRRTDDLFISCDGSWLFFQYRDIIDPGTEIVAIFFGDGEVDNFIGTNGITIYRYRDLRDGFDIYPNRIPLRLPLTVRIISTSINEPWLKDILYPMYIGSGIDQYIVLCSIGGTDQFFKTCDSSGQFFDYGDIV